MARLMALVSNYSSKRQQQQGATLLPFASAVGQCY
jgi:hypothetical protein